jgi:hypothetical protein
MSTEKIQQLKAMGAEVILTRSDVEKGDPAYYQDLAKRLADETPGAFYIDQFSNRPIRRPMWKPQARKSGSKWNSGWMRLSPVLVPAAR